MVKCCECGKEIEENSEEAILDVPFGVEIVHFCGQGCYDGATKI